MDEGQSLVYIFMIWRMKLEIHLAASEENDTYAFVTVHLFFMSQ